MSEADRATPAGAPPASTCPPAAPQRPGASSGAEPPQAAAAAPVDGDVVPKAAEAAGGERAEAKVLARRMTGTVKWFNVKEGYGFIIRSDTHAEVFVHQSAISRNGRLKSRRSVGEGETVEFDLVQSERGTEAAAVTGPAGSEVEGSRYARDRDRDRDRDRARARHGSRGRYPAPAPAPGRPGREPERPDRRADGGRARRPSRSPSCRRARARGPRGREHPEADDHGRAPADRAPRPRGPPGPRRAPARAPRGAEDTNEDKDAADRPRAPRGCTGQRRVTYRCAHSAKGPQAARDEGARDAERPLRPEWAIAAGRGRASSGGPRSAHHRAPDQDRAPQDSASFRCSSDVRRRAAPRGPRWPSDRGGEQAAAAESRHYPRAFAMRPRGRTQRPAGAAKAEPVAHAGEDSGATAQGPRRRAPDKAQEQEARRFPPPRRAPAEYRRSRPPCGPRAAHHPWSAPPAGLPRGGPGLGYAWPCQAPWRNTIPGPRGAAGTGHKPVARVVGRCWDAGTLQCIPVMRYGPSACRGLRCRPQSPSEPQARDPKGKEEIQARRAETPAPPSEEQSSSGERSSSGEQSSSGERSSSGEQSTSSEGPASTLAAK